MRPLVFRAIFRAIDPMMIFSVGTKVVLQPFLELYKRGIRIFIHDPMARRPSLWASTSVVPEPNIGSSTVSPGADNVSMNK